MLQNVNNALGITNIYTPNIKKQGIKSSVNAFNPKDLTLNDSAILTLSGMTEDQEKYTMLWSDYNSEFRKLYSHPGKSIVLKKDGLENMFEFYEKEVEKINNSEISEHEKGIKIDALTDALANATREFTRHTLYEISKIHFLTEEQKQTKTYSPQTPKKVFDQHMAIAYSIKKLMQNLLEFVGNGKTGFEGSMLDYVNKDSTNNRDIAKMSLKEVSDFVEYAKKGSICTTYSTDDEKSFSEFFNKINEDPSVTEQGRGNNVYFFSTETLKKYA